MRTRATTAFRISSSRSRRRRFYSFRRWHSIFKRDDDGDDPPEWQIENPAQRTAAATAAYRLLGRFRRIPGTESDGTINTDKLRLWVAEVRRLCAAYGRAEIGDEYIGQLLCKAPG